MRIGIIGAGQLGLMLGLAARELGHDCQFLDPADNPPAARAGSVIRARFDDPEALAQLARQNDVLSFEFENVAVEALRAIGQSVPVFPPPDALAIGQDRLTEKQLFERLAIPLPAYRVVDCREDLDKAARVLGYPAVLKTRRFGYDGKGQFVIRNERDLDTAWAELGGTALIAEAWVNFDREVSIIGVRSRSGQQRSWPLAQNLHRDGILHTSIAPAPASDDLSKLAISYLQRLLDELDYVGVLALELFVVGSTLLANEFAPRVHNSGHWTIEGSTCSQFSNHILAICGAEPGPADCRGHAGMINLVGTMPVSAGTPGDPRVTIHDYGKAPRPGRKLGHITLLAETPAARDELLTRLLRNVT